MSHPNFPSPEEFRRIFAEEHLSEFSPSIEWHVRAVAPYGLAPAIQRILELEGAASSEYEEARKQLLAACQQKWLDI